MRKYARFEIRSVFTRGSWDEKLLVDALKAEIVFHLKNLWGLSYLTEVIRKAASFCLKEKKPRAAPLWEDTSTSAGESRSRYIPAHVKRQVRIRDKGCCIYVDSETGFACSTRWRIEFDHIVPFALGGGNTVENLRLRCFAHNQWHSIEEFGRKVLGYAWRSSSSC